MASLILFQICQYSTAEGLEQKGMPAYLIPLLQRIAMPLPSIEKHVLQLSVASKYGIRGERLCEIEAIVYLVSHLFAAPLAKVEHTVLGVPTPSVPRSCLGNGPPSFAVVGARLGLAHCLGVMLLSLIF